MKKNLSVLICIFFSIHVHAQDTNCNDAVIMNIKDKWTTSTNDLAEAEKTFPSGQYNQLYSRLDKIAALYQQAYPDPAGLRPTWYRSVRGASMIKNGPVPYRFNSFYSIWYCNQNYHKLMVAGETGTWSMVYINSFGWLMTDQFDKAGFTIEGADAYMFPKKIGEWKGFPLYEPTASPKGNKAILITRNNQLPYKPVSRLQFLQSLKKKIEADKKIQLDNDKKITVRSDAEEEAAKQKGLQDIEKTVGPKYWEQRKAGYLKNYKTDEQRKQENIRLMEEYFDKKLKPLNDELANESSLDLQQPAIVGNDANWAFKGFTTDENGGRLVVLINTDYFDLRLPRYVPQFIVMYWSWDKNTPVQNFKKHLEEDFPIDKLKAMIDK